MIDPSLPQAPLDLIIDIGSDDPAATFGVMGVEGAGADWRLTLSGRYGLSLVISTLDGGLTAVPWEGFEPAVLVTWHRSIAQSEKIREGRWSRWRLDMISASGLTRVVARGSVIGMK